jgi:CRISPR/Cas system CSM-associated protein Csm2 small subunit
MVPTKLDTTESIAKDNTLMQIFFFAFIKWLSVKPELRVLYDIERQWKKNESLVDVMDLKIKKLIESFNKGECRFKYEHFSVRPYGFVYTYTEANHIRFLFDQFKISFSLGKWKDGSDDIQIEAWSYNNTMGKRFESTEKLRKFMMDKFDINFMIQNYNQNLEYCFKENFFEEIYQHFEKLWHDRIMDLIINYGMYSSSNYKIY